MKKCSHMLFLTRTLVVEIAIEVKLLIKGVWSFLFLFLWGFFCFFFLEVDGHCS